MVTEEIELGAFLERHGIESLETDLGEFIVQLDADQPEPHRQADHAQGPARDRAHLREGTASGPTTTTPEVITAPRARSSCAASTWRPTSASPARTSSRPRAAAWCWSPTRATRASAWPPPAATSRSSGSRRWSRATRDLGLFSTSWPARRPGSSCGLHRVHRRPARRRRSPTAPKRCTSSSSTTAAARSWPATAARSCAASAAAPASTSARSTGRRAATPTAASTPGPVGAVLSPLLAGERFPELADLPRASSLCGACNEVCPVDIPIPDLLLRLRDRGKRAGVKPAGAAPSMKTFARLASRPRGLAARFAGRAAARPHPRPVAAARLARVGREPRPAPLARGGVPRLDGGAKAEAGSPGVIDE